MKKCPQCAAVYNDDMSFCLNDGATLTSAAAESNMPATVFSIQPPPTLQNQTPPPTVFGGAAPNTNEQPHFNQQPSFNQPPQYNQQPQFNQPPPQQFNQPQWGSQASTPPKKSYGGLIILGVLLVLGLVGIGGGAMIFMFSSSSQPSTVYTATPTPNKTPEYDQSLTQGDAKNGFKKVSDEDVTSQKFYPSANKTGVATYSDGSQTVVSYMSVYEKPADAEAAFNKLLDKIRTERKTVTTRKDNYVYFNNGSSYSTAFWLNNKLYEFNADDQNTLYRFAK
jgi:hypothetical protein